MINGPIQIVLFTCNKVLVCAWGKCSSCPVNCRCDEDTSAAASHRPQSWSVPANISNSVLVFLLCTSFLSLTPQSPLSLRLLCPKIATCSSQKRTHFCTIAPSLFPSLYLWFLFVPFCQRLGLTTSDLRFPGKLGGLQQKWFLPSLSLLPAQWKHKPTVPVSRSWSVGWHTACPRPCCTPASWSPPALLALEFFGKGVQGVTLRNKRRVLRLAAQSLAKQRLSSEGVNPGLC